MGCCQTSTFLLDRHTRLLLHYVLKMQQGQYHSMGELQNAFPGTWTISGQWGAVWALISCTMYTVFSYMLLDLFPLFSVTTEFWGLRYWDSTERKKTQRRNCYRKQFIAMLLKWFHRPLVCYLKDIQCIIRSLNTWQIQSHKAQKNVCSFFTFFYSFVWEFPSVTACFPSWHRSNPVGVQEMLRYEQRAHFNILDNRISMNQHSH